MMLEMEKTCMNCKHWGDLVEIPYYDHTDKKMRKTEAAPCKVGANFVDMVGTNYVLMGEDGTCEDDFEPSADYLEALKDAEDFNKDPAAYYGVKPGVDFPATL